MLNARTIYRAGNCMQMMMTVIIIMLLLCAPSVAAVEAAHEDGHGLIRAARLHRIVRSAIPLACAANELPAASWIDTIRSLRV